MWWMAAKVLGVSKMFRRLTSYFPSLRAEQSIRFGAAKVQMYSDTISVFFKKLECMFPVVEILRKSITAKLILQAECLPPGKQI